MVFNFIKKSKRLSSRELLTQNTCNGQYKRRRSPEGRGEEAGECSLTPDSCDISHESCSDGVPASPAEAGGALDGGYNPAAYTSLDSGVIKYTDLDDSSGSVITLQINSGSNLTSDTLKRIRRQSSQQALNRTLTEKDIYRSTQSISFCQKVRKRCDSVTFSPMRGVGPLGGLRPNGGGHPRTGVEPHYGTLGGRLHPSRSIPSLLISNLYSSQSMLLDETPEKELETSLPLVRKGPTGRGMTRGVGDGQEDGVDPAGAEDAATMQDRGQDDEEQDYETVVFQTPGPARGPGGGDIGVLSSSAAAAAAGSRDGPKTAPARMGQCPTSLLARLNLNPAGYQPPDSGNFQRFSFSAPQTPEHEGLSLDSRLRGEPPARREIFPNQTESHVIQNGGNSFQTKPDQLYPDEGFNYYESDSGVSSLYEPLSFPSNLSDVEDHCDLDSGLGTLPRGTLSRHPTQGDKSSLTTLDQLMRTLIQHTSVPGELTALFSPGKDQRGKFEYLQDCLDLSTLNTYSGPYGGTLSRHPKAGGWPVVDGDLANGLVGGCSGSKQELGKQLARSIDREIKEKCELLQCRLSVVESEKSENEQILCDLESRLFLNIDENKVWHLKSHCQELETSTLLLLNIANQIICQNDKLATNSHNREATGKYRIKLLERLQQAKEVKKYITARGEKLEMMISTKLGESYAVNFVEYTKRKIAIVVKEDELCYQLKHLERQREALHLLFN